MHRPKVSFVVPCYMYGHLLAECIDSILMQSFSDFEILIMDDCSPDCTPQVAMSYHDSRIIYIRNEKNLGNIRNFNKGIKLSRGEHIWLISADDRLKSDRILKRYVNLLDENPNVGYVFCPAVALLDDGEETFLDASRFADVDRIIPAGDSMYFDALLMNTVFNLISPTVMIRKECYERITYFPESLPLRGDTFIWAMFAMQYDIGYFAEPMVNYRVHNASALQRLLKNDLNFVMKDDIEVLWQINKELKIHGNRSLIKCCEEALSNTYAFYLASALCNDNKTGLTIDDFKKSLCSHGSDSREHRRICESTFRKTGDYIRWKNYPSLAIKMYELALHHKLWNPPVWAKLLLSVCMLTCPPLALQIVKMRNKLR